MNSYKTTFKTWNTIASLYEEVFMDMDLYNDTYDAFCRQLIKEKPSILEIGCGPGNITKHIIAQRPDCNIMGIDVAPNMIALAKKNNPSASFSVMDGRQINTLKTNFDAIIAGFYIPYISESDLVHFIKDSSKLLQDDGLLYISFVEGEYNNSGYQTGSSGDKVYFYFHQLKRLKKELTTHQFIITKILYKEYPKKDKSIETHTVVISRKRNN